MRSRLRRCSQLRFSPVSGTLELEGGREKMAEHQEKNWSEFASERCVSSGGETYPRPLQPSAQGVGPVTVASIGQG